MLRVPALALLLALGACAAFGPGPMPAPPPPAPAEAIPLPPATEDLLIWQPGHWDLDGLDYVWRPGAYVAREGHGNLWQPGYWAPGDRVWVWVAPHWM